MELQAYKDEIITELGGDILESVKKELPDSSLDKIIQKALRETQRFINITRIKTVTYTDCISMDNGRTTNATINIGDECLDVVDVQRANVGSMGLGGHQLGTGIPDPLYLAMSTKSSGSGFASGIIDGYKNLMQWRQVANTITTDLRFEYDTQTGKLYINAPNPRPSAVTIWYTPRFKDISEIRDPYWEDIIYQFALAHAKITLGRIRGRYNLSNALWDQDAETLLQEGNQELTDLRLKLEDNTTTAILY